MRLMGSRRGVVAAVLALAMTLACGSVALAETESGHGQRLVESAAGMPVVHVRGRASLHGVDIDSPRDRATFATPDAMIAVLEEGQSTATFGLPSEGAVLPDGAVLLTSGHHVARIDSPWAKDANGRSLETWYTVHGRSLTQHVDTHGASFPIAADPRLTYGWGVYLNVTGAEAKALATGLVAIGGAGAIVGCAGLAKLPSVVAKIVSVLCTAVGAPTIRSILSSISVLWRNGASTYTCYQKRIVGPSTGWYKVAMANCTG